MKYKTRNFLNLLIITISLTDCTGKGTPTITLNSMVVSPQLTMAREKIKHIVIILQENRSFDHYFGTYLGADGNPSKMANHVQAAAP